MLSTPEFLLSNLGGVFLLFFSEAIGHILGLLVFAVLTFGTVRVQCPEERGLAFPWHGFTRNEKGQFVVQMEVAAVVGMLAGIFAYLLFLMWRSGAFGR